MLDAVSREHRRSLRTPVTLPITLYAGANGRKLEYYAVALDLSCQGTRVRTPLPLSQGQVVTVALDYSGGYAVPGRVVWVGPEASDREGQVGIEFAFSLPLPV
jgi:hypothetical protein